VLPRPRRDSGRVPTVHNNLGIEHGDPLSLPEAKREGMKSGNGMLSNTIKPQRLSKAVE